MRSLRSRPALADGEVTKRIRTKRIIDRPPASEFITVMGTTCFRRNPAEFA